MKKNHAKHGITGSVLPLITVVVAFGTGVVINSTVDDGKTVKNGGGGPIVIPLVVVVVVGGGNGGPPSIIIPLGPIIIV
jgi:hypothetical protein